MRGSQIGRGAGGGGDAAPEPSRVRGWEPALFAVALAATLALSTDVYSTVAGSALAFALGAAWGKSR